MSFQPERAFVLAAGFGKRLRPYTSQCPKPLIEVCGRPIIDHVLEKLAFAGVTQATVNLHYKAEMLENHLAGRMDLPRVTLSHEPVLLDTGGGMKKALPVMGETPFYACSGDSLWTDGPEHKPALLRLAEAWDSSKMDLLLLLQPLSKMELTSASGDYDLSPDGRAIRSLDKTGAYAWTGIRLCAPSLFDDTQEGAFSFLELMDRAEKQGRLYALVHTGEWHHISTPEDLERVNAYMGGSFSDHEPVSGGAG